MRYLLSRKIRLIEILGSYVGGGSGNEMSQVQQRQVVR